MNIYLHELKSRWKSILIWSIAVAAMLFLFMSLFQGFAADTALVTRLMKSFPPELLTAFGMNDMDWSTILGFLGLIFVFIQVCLAVQAANYGFGLVSVEETEWTADFLLSRPVSRPQIMTSKLLAALTALAITDAVTWACTFITISIFGQGLVYSMKPVLLVLTGTIIFQLFFLSLGMLISLLVKRIRSVTPYTMALVFGLYILNAFGNMIGEASLEVLSPFKHFAPNYIINHSAWDLPMVLISVAVILISLPGSYLLYTRRNIPSPV